ncbi:peptidoglycan bridge formation glycyltransferase FemA/FemB family protein [Candidatus Saccharibacteria bacterium]|nr:peptidoglycan bridge formation glycyltransferase FemA/FemB family protein [Candidatus Saccharibacteria bacterium]
METARRQHFIPPDLKTLLAEREAFGKNAQIYIASLDDKIAYGLTISDGDEAEYFEAASTDLNRKLPGAYALQWQAMKDLKKQGIKRYNLWGIAPPGVKNHRYSGVTTFKTGFGGEIVEFVPAHDIIISPARYKIDLAVEKLRKKRRNL